MVNILLDIWAIIMVHNDRNIDLVWDRQKYGVKLCKQGC